MKNGFNQLIVGYGEVGRGLAEVLKQKGKVWILDPNKSLKHNNNWPKKFYAIHICIPFSNSFSQAVRGIKKKYGYEILIIHSTVPVGTSDKLGAVHSPIRGDHPNLAKGIKTFVKYVGGKNSQAAAKLFKSFADLLAAAFVLRPIPINKCLGHSCGHIRRGQSKNHKCRYASRYRNPF